MVTLYADTSALAKLIRPEVESTALATFLAGGNDWGETPELISSDLTTVELHRAARETLVTPRPRFRTLTGWCACLT